MALVASTVWGTTPRRRTTAHQQCVLDDSARATTHDHSLVQVAGALAARRRVDAGVDVQLTCPSR